MTKTYLLSQIKERIDIEEEYLIVDGDYVVICGVEKPQRIKILFKKAGMRYVEINLEETVNFIVEKLSPKIDVPRFLKELILLYSSPEEIEELKERLSKAPKITPADECYSLMIGGKPGRPHEFNIVG